MAPGSQQKRKNPKAKSKKALSVDFKRVKSKVGRKLPPPKNATKIEFKSKGIVVPGQSVGQDKTGLRVNQRDQTLKELLAQTSHYSERTRKDALMGLKDLFGKHRRELIVNVVVIIDKLSPMITDADKNVRQALLLLFQTSVFPQLTQAMMKAVIRLIMAHVCSAMSHLVLDIRVAASYFLQSLLQHFPTLILPSFELEIVEHYVTLLGRGDISGQGGIRLVSVLNSLEQFLSALKRLISTPSGTSESSKTYIWNDQVLLTPKTDRWDDQEPHRVRQALHGYNSALPEGNRSFGAFAGEEQWGQKVKQIAVPTGAPGQLSYAVTPLVAVLLKCWTECSPLVKGPNPDANSLECLVIITRCLCYIFQTITIEAGSISFAKHSSSRTLLNVPVYGSEEWETHMWMQKEFLPGLCQHLPSAFPCTAPVVRLLPKVEGGLVALNMGVCEVLLQFFPSCYQDMEVTFVSKVLECIMDALYGTMLPASEYASALSDPKLAALYIKTWIQYLPNLVTCVPSAWVSPLLEALTHVFKSCNSRSNVKRVCLSSMSELLLPGRNSVGRTNFEQTLVPVDIQSEWLDSLPKLLWELKTSDPNISQAVLEMLLHVGQFSRDGSALAERYNGLQQAIVPFFSTRLIEARWFFGPFINLPMACQELATALLYNYISISPVFLSALAKCCLCLDLDESVAVRIVEVLQSAFCKGRGAKDSSEHLSFLVTLLLRPISSRNDKSPEKAESETLAYENAELCLDLSFETRRRRSSLVGVVCRSLKQMGDGHIVLAMLGPTIRRELEKHIRSDVVEGLFRIFGFLSYEDKKSDGLFIPEELIEMFPKIVADFLVSIALMHDVDGVSYDESVCSSFKDPCMKFLSRSPRFTRSVLKCLHGILRRGPDPASSKLRKKRVAAAQIALEMLKTKKLYNVLSGAVDTFKAIMTSLEEDHGDIYMSEGRDLKRLQEQLLTATRAHFGSKYTAQ